jgi:hypothetical protein
MWRYQQVDFGCRRSVERLLAPTPTYPPSTSPPTHITTDSLTAAGAKLLKDASSEGGQDVGAVADADGYAVTLVDIEQFNAQLA